jgi:hypothetical protein
MAPVVETSGTQTAVISTEHTLSAPSVAQTRFLTVNLKNMAAGDIVELRVYDKTLTGDTITVGSATTMLYLATYQGPVSQPVVQSPFIPVAYAATFTLKQTSGTGRSYDWHVCTVD